MEQYSILACPRPWNWIPSLCLGCERGILPLRARASHFQRLAPSWKIPILTRSQHPMLRFSNGLFSTPKSFLFRCRQLTITTEPVVPQSTVDAIVNNLTRSHEASQQASQQSNNARYDFIRDKNTELAVEAAVLRGSVKSMARDQHASKERVNLRGCIGEIQICHAIQGPSPCHATLEFSP